LSTGSGLHVAVTEVTHDAVLRCPRAGTLQRMRITHSVEVTAPIDLVWRVYTDVERWPQWMESMEHVDLAESGGSIEGEPLQLGSQVWISQPRLPNAMWEVTELTPGRGWTWVSRSTGATSTASHQLTAVDTGTTRVDTTLEMTGLLGGLAGRMIARRAAQYMAMEAEGLRAACATATD
jgi:uncharacterized membrane protein